MLQEEIKRLREAKGYTQEELASKIPMTQHALSQIENGKRGITIELFEDIMKALDTTPTLLVEEGDKKTVSITDYFRGMAGLKKQFPKWDVRHTGGNCHLLTKSFKTQTKESVAVCVSDVAAFIMRKMVKDPTAEYGVRVVEGYVAFEEWKQHDEFYLENEELCAEILFYNVEEEVQLEPLATTLFTEKDIAEMKRVSDAL